MAEVSSDAATGEVGTVLVDVPGLRALHAEVESLRGQVRAFENAIRHRPGGIVLIHSQDRPHVDRVNVYARIQVDAGNGATAFIDAQTVRQAAAVLGVELAR